MSTRRNSLRVTVLGARGSFPVEGAEFQRYGGRTTALIVEAGDDVVLIDAGSGLICNEHRFAHAPVVHMVFTHFHMDHILAFPFFPFHLQKGQKIVVHHDPALSPDPRSALFDFVRRPHFPMDHGALDSRFVWTQFHGSFEVGGLSISAFALNHPDFAVGYRFRYDGREYVHISDHEHEPAWDGRILSAIGGAHLVTMDAMYDAPDYRPGWGHSRWPDVVDLAVRGGVERLLLWHHHYHYTDRRLEHIVSEAQTLHARTDAAHEGGITTI